MDYAGAMRSFVIAMLHVAALAGAARAQSSPPSRLPSAARLDPAHPAGTLTARVLRGATGATHAGVEVALFGFTDERITVARKQTDAQGDAAFTGLDRSGATSYLAMALAPRGKGFDRLMTNPVELPDGHGARAVLVGEAADSPAPPLDEASRAAPAGGKITLRVFGVAAAGADLAVIDAATGKALSRRKADLTPGTDVTLDAPRAHGRTLYVEAAVGGTRYRSSVVWTLADRGAELGLVLSPRLSLAYTIQAHSSVRPSGPDALVARIDVEIMNYAFSPYRAGPRGFEIPLPRGFTDVELDHTAGSAGAALGRSGIVRSRPLAPGATRIAAVVLLPARDGKVDWTLDLPHGMTAGNVALSKEPGAALATPMGAVETHPTPDGELLVARNLSAPPGGTLALTITMPVYAGEEATRRRLCRTIQPKPRHPLLGKPLLDFTAPDAAGKRFKLSSLRGKPILVTFSASWNAHGHDEPPTLAKLAAAVPRLQIVVVASDHDAAATAPLGVVPPLRLVLDPPDGHDPNNHLGPITHAWSVPAVPESFLIDAKGIVRMYVLNKRDWSTPEAAACVKHVLSAAGK